MRTLPDLPWGSDLSLALRLDLLYIENHSGERYVSPILNRSDDELTSSFKENVINAAYSIYKNKWTRLWEVNTAEFNPIENYDMTETHTGTDTGLKTPTGWKETETQTPTNWKETETQTPTNWKKTTTETPDEWAETTVQTPEEWTETTEGLKADNTSKSTGSVYAFNSATAVPSTESDTEVNSKQTKTQDGTYTTTHTQSGSRSTEESQEGTYQTETARSGSYQTETSHTGTFEDKMTYNSTLHRSGNVGVTTSQQMLESSIKLWEWSFFETVFKDLDKILTLDTY